MDGAKGLAIVLVVYGHVVRGLISAGLCPDVEIWMLVDRFIYGFHMATFFMISGMLLSVEQNVGREEPLRDTIAKKAGVLIWPYLIWVGLQGFVEYCVSPLTNAKAGLDDILWGFVFPRSQFWFLPALFFIYVMALFLMKIKGGRVLVMCLSVVLLISCPTIRLCENMIFFAAGLFFSPQVIVSLSSSWRFLLFIVVGFLYLSVLHVFAFYPQLEIFIRALVGLFGALSLIELAVHFARTSRWLVFLGASSLVIYLSHILFGSGMRVFLLHALKLRNFYDHVVLGLIVGICGPLFLAFLCRRFNLRWLFSVRLRRSSTL